MDNTYEWSGIYQVSVRYALGLAGRHNRGARGGGKVHIMKIEEVVGLLNGHVPSTGDLGAKFLKTGSPVLFGLKPVCGATSGQWAGRQLPNNSAPITCTRCAKLDKAAYIK